MSTGLANASATKPKKLTLVEQQGLIKVRDPSQHAKRQVGELDKTAKRSLAKRKACNDQLESDKKELEHINQQIAMIKKGYFQFFLSLFVCILIFNLLSYEILDMILFALYWLKTKKKRKNSWKLLNSA